MYINRQYIFLELYLYFYIHFFVDVNFMKYWFLKIVKSFFSNQVVIWLYKKKIFIDGRNKCTKNSNEKTMTLQKVRWKKIGILYDLHFGYIFDNY